MASGLQFQDNPGRGFITAAAIAQYLLVQIPAGVLTLCALDTNNDWIGTTLESRFAANQVVPVRFRHAGTLPCTTDNTAIVVGTLVYKAANGTVSATSTSSILVGIALAANGSVAGSWIEVMPI